jgi:hypothetical protein
MLYFAYWYILYAPYTDVSDQLVIGLIVGFVAGFLIGHFVF